MCAWWWGGVGGPAAPALRKPENSAPGLGNCGSASAASTLGGAESQAMRPHPRLASPLQLRPRSRPPKPRPNSAPAPIRAPPLLPSGCVPPPRPAAARSRPSAAPPIGAPGPPRALLRQPPAHLAPPPPPVSRAGFRGRHDGGRVLRLRLHCLRACARPLYLHHRHRAVARHLPHRRVRR